MVTRGPFGFSQTGDEASEDKLPAKYSRILYFLGRSQILLGASVATLESAGLIIYYCKPGPGFELEYLGIWTGIFAVLTGVVQVQSVKRSVSFLVHKKLLTLVLLSLISFLQATFLFSLTLINIEKTKKEISRRESGEKKVDSDDLTSDQLNFLEALRSVIASVYITLAVVAIAAMVLDCCSACLNHRPDDNQTGKSALENMLYIHINNQGIVDETEP